MRALVVANGEPPSKNLAMALHAGADTVIAADGGADRALQLGIEPDQVLGDLDSVSQAARDRLGADRFHRIANVATTDLEKAVGYAIDHGASDVDVICAGGGRADHALANLSVLVTFRGRARVEIHDDLFAISLVHGQGQVEGPAGTVVSLVPIGQCLGVTTSGLRWDLSDRTLDFGPLGIHNEIAHSPASVSVRSGDLLIFRGRWVEKHA